MSLNDRADPSAPPLVARYTALLFAAGLLMLAIAGVEHFAIPQVLAAGYSKLAAFLQADQRGSLILAPLTLLAAVSRRQRWGAARLLTWSLSVLLVFYFPLGTAVFTYWVGWVRPSESGRRLGAARGTTA